MLALIQYMCEFVSGLCFKQNKLCIVESLLFQTKYICSYLLDFRYTKYLH